MKMDKELPGFSNNEETTPKRTVNEDWRRTCLRLDPDEFIQIAREVYGPNVCCHFDMDGLWLTDSVNDEWVLDDDQLIADLSGYFSIDVMSVHLDDDDNTNVWINYLPGKSKEEWYRISADGGKSWTEQYLTEEEAVSHLGDGYMIVKSSAMKDPPKIKVIAVYDYTECCLQLFADVPNIEAELIDTGSADPTDPGYQAHSETISARRKEIVEAYNRNEIFFIGEH